MNFGESKMSFGQAHSWLNQTGVKAIMPADKDTQGALRKAMEALEKQIAKPYVSSQNERDVKGYYCPCCHLELGDEDWDGEPNKDWLPFCDRCGQKIKWIKR